MLQSHSLLCEGVNEMRSISPSKLGQINSKAKQFEGLLAKPSCSIFFVVDDWKVGPFPFEVFLGALFVRLSSMCRPCCLPNVLLSIFGEKPVTSPLHVNTLSSHIRCSVKKLSLLQDFLCSMLQRNFCAGGNAEVLNAFSGANIANS